MLNRKHHTCKPLLLSTFGRLLHMIAEKNRGILILQVLIISFISVLPVLVSFFWQLILMRVASPSNTVIVLFISLALSGSLMVSNGYFREIVDTIFRNAVSINLQKQVHAKATRLPMDDYENPQMFDTMDRASEAFFYGDAVGFLVTVLYVGQMLLSVAAMSIWVCGYHFSLLLPLVAIILVKSVRLRLNKRALERKLKLEPMRREYNTYRRYITKYEHIKESRVLGASDYFRNKWEDTMDKTHRQEELEYRQLAFYQILLDVLERLVILSAYLLCIALIQRNVLAIGQFGGLIVLLGQYVQNSERLVNTIQSLHEDVLHIHSSLKYFELPEEKRTKTLAEPIESIRLEHVSYRYPSMECLAVQDVNLTLKTNETIAIVGKNGSGKSTLSKLLSGLICPTSGTVWINGMTSQDIQMPSLYKEVSVVLQDFSHYYLSLRDNIRLGDIEKECSDEGIKDLLRSMRVKILSGERELSLDSPLGVEYGGQELSGGQWQQLAIVRAKYKEAALVTLDEPTSALDPLKEAQMYESFRSLCAGKIGMLITHRLSLCALADSIAVMQEGRIVEYGTHEQLIKQNGIYAEMFRRQSLMYEDTVCDS